MFLTSNIYHLNALLKRILIQLLRLLQEVLTKCLLIQKQILVDKSWGSNSENTISCLDCQKLDWYESIKHEFGLNNLTGASFKVPTYLFNLFYQ